MFNDKRQLNFLFNKDIRGSAWQYYASIQKRAEEVGKQANHN
jgi:hypothetical protein